MHRRRVVPGVAVLAVVAALAAGCDCDGGGTDAAASDAAQPPGLLVAARAHDPFVEPDGEGGAYVAFSLETDCGADDLFVQRVAPNGEFLWPAPGVRVARNCVGGGAHGAKLSYDRIGGVFVSWYAGSPTSGGPWDWFIQHLNADGVERWSLPYPISGTASSGVCIEKGPPGEVWAGWNEDVDTFCEACLQRYDLDGPIFAARLALVPISGGSATIVPPIRSIAALSDGTLVVYRGNVEVGPLLLLMNVYELDGSPRWADATGPLDVDLGVAVVAGCGESTAERPGGEIFTGYWRLSEGAQAVGVDTAGALIGPIALGGTGSNLVGVSGLGDGRLFFAWLEADGPMVVEELQGTAPVWSTSLTTAPNPDPFSQEITAGDSHLFVTWTDDSFKAAALTIDGNEAGGPVPLGPGERGGLVPDLFGNAIVAWAGADGVRLQFLDSAGPRF